MPISLSVNSDKTTVPRWIKHFEQQALNGSSSRSLFNRRLIVVEKFPSEISVKEADHLPLPSIVSPVQQSVEQAKEEIKREVTLPEGQEFNSKFRQQVSTLLSPAQTDQKSGSLNISPKVTLSKTLKRSRKRKLIDYNDIFS